MSSLPEISVSDQSKYDALVVRYPGFLTPAEHKLANKPRYELIRRKLNEHNVKLKAREAANAAIAAQRAQNGGQAAGQPQPPPPPQQQQQQQQQQQAITNAQQQQILLQQQLQQQQQQQQMQQNGTPMVQHAQVQQQRQSPAQVNQGVPMDNNQLYQQQQFIQQQQQQQQQGQQPTQQQQQHMKTMLEAQQRLQRQAVQQQHAQQNTPHIQQQQLPNGAQHPISALPSNLTAPSPQQQQQQLMGSPVIGRNGRSPSQGSVPAQQQMRMPTPVQGNAQLPMQGQMQQQQGGQEQWDQAKVLTESFPMLWELKRKGKLGPDQDKLFNQLLASAEGRAQLEQFHIQHASNIANQIAPHANGQQQPQMTHSQMALAAQQQLAPLQQQQAMHAQQLQNGGQQFVNGNVGPNGNPHAHMQIQALQNAQAQAAQRAQAQQNFNNLTPQQQQHLQQQQMQMQQQAATVARSQQAQQLMQAQHAMQVQQAQAQAALGQQQGQHGDPNGHAPSPRPGSVAPMQGQAQGQQYAQQQPQRTQQSTLQSLNQLVTRIDAMGPEEKEAFWLKKPDLRSVYNQLKSNPQSLNMLSNQALLQGNQGQAGPPGTGTPGNNGSPALPANSNGQFPVNNQRVSANLHIPASKQRNLLPNQQVAGTPSSTGSPARIPTQMSTPQQAALRSMVNSGYPVQPGQGVGGVRAGPGAPGYPLDLQAMSGAGMDLKNIKPEMLIAQINTGMPRGRAPSIIARRGSEMQVSTSGFGFAGGNSESNLAKATWQPDAEYDAALPGRLWNFKSPSKPAGRATLMQGFAQGRVLSGVPVEQVPDAIRLIAEEAERDSMAQKNKEVDPVLPSNKKRKIQELADNVDKGLVINGELETVLLKLSDEHLNTISQVSCNLAKHRRSDTLDRKDVQLAYETICGRAFPGFSSDQIRMDQSKPAKRPPINAQRANKLRLANDHKANWKRERAEARQAASEGGGSGGMAVTVGA